MKHYRYISILFLSFFLIFGVGEKMLGQYVVDFEGETKGSYASDTVNLSGLDWDMTEALIGSTDNDWKNGERSARMRGYGTSSMTMLENKINGLGIISFEYRRYGTDDQVDWKVEYSTDNGDTWTQAGEDFTAPASDDVQTFSEEVNVTGDVRIRIKRATETGTDDRRLNVDDIALTDYIPEELIPDLVVDFDDENNWIAGSGGINSYQTDHVYEDRFWTFTGGPALRQTSSDVDGYPGALGEYAWRLRDEDGVEWTATYNSRGLIVSFGFKVRRWNDSPNPNYSVKYSVDGGISYSGSIVTIDNDFLEDSSDWKTFIYTFSEPVAVDCGDFVVKVSRNSGERIMIDDFAFGLQECENPDWHYKTISSSYWEDACIWLFSEDGENNWENAYCAPNEGASSAIVQEGHEVIVDSDLSISNTVIKENAILHIQSGTLNIAGEHEDNGIIVNTGGVLNFDGGLVPDFEEGVNILVESEAVIRVSTNTSELSGALAGNDSEDKVIYESAAVFEWDASTSFLTRYQEYFPSACEATIPVFRIARNLTNVGAGSNTHINGVFEANGNITWRSSGDKVFRNGITGSGTITQDDDCGPFIISGNEAQLGGSGLLNLGSSGLILSSGSNTDLISDKTIAGGNVLVNGVLNGSSYNLSIGGDLEISEEGTFNKESSTLIFDGTTQQNLVINGLCEFYNIELNNVNGLIINNDIIVSNALTLNAGDILNEGFNLIIGTGAEQAGDIEYVSGTVHGKVVRWVPESYTGELVLPVGKPSLENPAWVEFTEPPQGGTLKAEFVVDIPDNYYGNLPFEEDGIYFDNLADEGFWRIDADNGLSGGVYNITLDAGTIIEINDPEHIRILKRDTGSDEWTLSGDYSYSGTLFTHSGISGFSEFAFGGNSENNPLPIELLYFKTKANEGQVNLKWATASETNNDYFTIERTTNFANIDVVATLPGAGNSTQTNYYSFTDKNPAQGINYYRLKQTDYDGSYEYSSWEAVDLSQKEASLRIISINQEAGMITLSVETTRGADLHIQATDIFGRIVYDETVNAGQPQIKHKLNLQNLSGNMLIIRVSDNRDMDAGKVFVY